MLGKTIRIDCCRGDDDLEIRAHREQPRKVTQDKVNVEAAFVGLVNDQGIVAAQHWI